MTPAENNMEDKHVLYNPTWFWGWSFAVLCRRVFQWVINATYIYIYINQQFIPPESR